MQKAVFYIAKGGLLQRERWPFASRKYVILAKTAKYKAFHGFLMAVKLEIFGKIWYICIHFGAYFSKYSAKSK